MFIKQILVYILKYKDNMIEDYEEKPVKQFIIIYYESLMKDAINREDYEMAAKVVNNFYHFFYI